MPAETAGGTPAVHPHHGAPRTFKPRRRPLSPARATAFDALRAQWCLDEQGGLLDPVVVFGRRAPLVLEIGSGAGETTLAVARARPDVDVIAVEVHTPGVARLVQQAAALGRSNVRVVHGDALEFLGRLGPASLAAALVLFPDPWPKARHRVRRLVRPDVVAVLADRLADGGVLYVATDVGSYAAGAAAAVGADGRFDGGEVPRPSWRPTTRFEVKALAAGRTVTDLRFVRRPRPAPLA